MRLCMISGSFPTMRCGIADQVWHLSQHLVAAGHEVTVVTSRNQQTEEGAEALPDGGPRVLPVIDSWQRPDSLLAVLKPLECEVIQLEYETALYGRYAMVNHLPRTLRAKGLSQPIVTRFHDLWGPRLFPGAGQFGLRERHVAALARHSSVALLANAQHQARLTQMVPERAADIRHMPLGPGIAPTATPEDAAKVRAALGIADDEVLAVNFGLIQSGTGKGMESLLRAVAALPREAAHWVVIGGSHGPTGRNHENRLHGLAQGLGLSDRLQWTGYASPERASAILSASNVCVLPFEDGAAMHRSSLVTAIAHRLPLVTTVSGALPEPLGSGTNVLAAQAGDPEDLAQKIAQLLGDAALRDRLRTNLAPLAQRHSWPQLAKDMEALYHHLLREPGTPASRRQPS